MSKIVYWDITEQWKRAHENELLFVKDLQRLFKDYDVTIDATGAVESYKTIYIWGSISNGEKSVSVDYSLILDGIKSNNSFKFYEVLQKEIEMEKNSFLIFQIESEKYSKFKEQIEKYLRKLGGHIYDVEKDLWEHYKKEGQ